MDQATMNKKIVDFTEDELVALGYLGDHALPRVKETVEAVRADPGRLGYMNVFMIECVKKQHAIPARGQGSPASPTSPTFSNAETLWTSMSDNSDVYTVVAPHVITPISGNPPELLYRSDLETKPFYVPTPGAQFSKIPTKIPNGVFDSVLNPKWDEIAAPRIIASMKTHGIKHSALWQTVQFTIQVLQDGQVTIGPVVIWIGIRLKTTNTEAVCDFTPEILHILSDNQIAGVNVEWFEGDVTKLTGPPLLPVVNRTNPAFGLNHTGG
ncbi:hypothetical protein C8Q79DRAFT_1004112 [Trametes meyenii]|nr:hypothetical protein C8Q79DRAFT_1004112 [Trametes meyenii]